MPQQLADKKTSNEVAWFAVRIALLCLGLNYVLGGLPTLLFVVGWWWGSKSSLANDSESY